MKAVQQVARLHVRQPLPAPVPTPTQPINGAGPEVVKAGELQVHRALTHLSATLDTLRSRAAELRDRLVPVCVDAPGNEGAERPPLPGTPLASILTQRTYELEEVVSIIESMLDRLQV